MFVRGIRGATTVEHNDAAEILHETNVMLHEIVRVNEFSPEDIACVFITVTKELDAAFPAKVIREMKGWELVPLMCSMEISVQNSLPKCIRLMVMVNTEKRQDEIIHVYLNGAKVLRPDLAEPTAK